MDLPEQWASIEADLERARSTLPQEAATSAAVRYYQEFLNHNELELVCDMLEAYAEDHQLCKEFWIALTDAATKMKLPSATRYTKFAEST